MTEPNHDPSIFNEPHLNPDGTPEPLNANERRAQQKLDHEKEKANRAYEPVDSVFDEPNIFPGRQGIQLTQDWSCSNCGYNLRGLRAGHSCPECGHIEIYAPPPENTDNYSSWLTERIQATRPSIAVRTVILCILLGGVWSVLASLLGHTRTGFTSWSVFFVVAFWAPTIEEIMKASATLYVVERRPYLFKTTDQVQIAAVGAALVFACIENLMYLHLYYPNASTKLVIWRWTICVALHVGCTTISSLGLKETWETAVRQRRKPELETFIPWLIRAILLHALYNSGVVGYEIMFGPLR